VPSGPSGALHTCGVVVIDVDRPARLLSRAAWCACARGRRPAREPSALRASLGASSRSPARPCRRPRVPQPGLPALPTPVGSWWLMRFGASSRSMARPCRRPPAPRSGLPGPPAPSMPVGQVVDVWFGASFPMSGQAPSPTDTAAIP